MAGFGRSNSLSINTGGSLFPSNTSQSQPTGGGLFGSSTTSSQPQQSGSLFGAPQQQQTGGLFGSMGSTAQPQQTGGLFGALGSTPQPQQTGGLFGAVGNTPQPQQTGGLFGAVGNTPQPQQTGGLFSAIGNTPQSQQTGGLFGAIGSTAQPQQQQQQQQQGAGMFGSQSTSGQTGSLFPTATTAPQQQQSLASLAGFTLGNNQSQNQNQNQSGGGLFSGLGAQNKPTIPSLFTPQTQQNQQKPSLFPPLSTAANTNQQQPSFVSSLGGGGAATTSILGNRLGASLLNQSNQASSMSGVKIDAAHMRGTTRFNDLHDELQKQIEQADSFIQQQISFAAQCSAILPVHAQNLSYIPTDAEYLAQKADTVELALDNDSTAIAKLKDIVSKDIEDARQIFRVVENLKLPQQFHYPGLMWSSGNAALRSSINATAADQSDDSSNPTDLVKYFSTNADEFAKTLSEYRRNVAEIEAHLRIVESTALTQSEALMAKRAARDGVDNASAGGNDDLRNLAAVLADFERGILNVASKVGAAREAVVEVTVGSGGG